MSRSRTPRDPHFGRQTVLGVQLLTLGLLSQAGAGERTETFFFVCDDRTSYTVQTTGTEAWVFRAGGSLRLPVLPDDNGGRYSDGSFEVHIEGQHAWIGQAAGTQLRCHNDRHRAVWEHAKLDGVDFRAVGNAPGWHLEIRELSRIIVVVD